jgi:hypothetical protein
MEGQRRRWWDELADDQRARWFREITPDGSWQTCSVADSTSHARTPVTLRAAATIHVATAACSAAAAAAGQAVPASLRRISANCMQGRLTNPAGRS